VPSVENNQGAVIQSNAQDDSSKQDEFTIADEKTDTKLPTDTETTNGVKTDTPVLPAKQSIVPDEGSDLSGQKSEQNSNSSNEQTNDSIVPQEPQENMHGTLGTAEDAATWKV